MEHARPKWWQKLWWPLATFATTAGLSLVVTAAAIMGLLFIAADIHLLWIGRADGITTALIAVPLGCALTVVIGTVFHRRFNDWY